MVEKITESLDNLSLEEKQISTENQLLVQEMQSKSLDERLVGFSYDNFMLLHENHKRPHPESPARLISIYTHLEKNTNLLEKCVKLKCPFIDLIHVERVHSKEMIEQIEKS